MLTSSALILVEFVALYAIFKDIEENMKTLSGYVPIPKAIAHLLYEGSNLQLICFIVLRYSVQSHIDNLMCDQYQFQVQKFSNH